MAKPRHLTRAPITEALIDIRVTLPEHTRTLDKLASLDERFGEHYQDKKTIHEVEYKFPAIPTQPGEASTRELGFRYTSKDNLQVIQATVSGLTFSRLSPYQDWDRLRNEARRVWSLYAETLQAETITRVAARYINKIAVPQHVDFDDFLHYVPRIPRVLPQAFAGFFSRVIVPDEKGQRTAIITQTFQPTPTELAVLLDIDCFRSKTFLNEQEAWDIIEQLRHFKNLIFFDSITEETARLYE
jgi:uncharacterized protein (TIGR04255 family)